MNKGHALDVMSLLGGLDSSLIDEAREHHAVKYKRRSAKKAVFVFAAAVMLLSASAVGASAVIKGYISHKENAAHELMNSELVSELESRAGEPIVCENSHLRLTVDMVMSDEDCIRCTATIEGLDDEGKRFISEKLTLPEEMKGMTEKEAIDYLTRNSGSDSFIPYMEVYTQSGELINRAGLGSGADLMYGKKGDDAEAAFGFCFERGTLNGEKSVRVQCRQADTYFTEDPGEGIFKGMSFELPTQTNLDTLILRTEDGGKEMHLSEVSVYPIGYRYDRYSQPDITIVYKNGTRAEKVSDQIITEKGLYRISEVEHIELDGARYYPAETVKAEKACE